VQGALVPKTGFYLTSCIHIPGMFFVLVEAIIYFTYLSQILSSSGVTGSSIIPGGGKALQRGWSGIKPYF